MWLCRWVEESCEEGERIRGPEIGNKKRCMPPCFRASVIVFFYVMFISFSFCDYSHICRCL